MIKNNPKLKKAFKKFKKTGDAQDISDELIRQAQKSVSENKELVTVI